MSEKEEQKETIVTTATESPESVVSNLIDEKRRQELAERLQLLKTTLDKVEKRMTPESEDGAGVLSPKDMEYIIKLCQTINCDLRLNLEALNNFENPELTEQMSKNALDVMNETSLIYGEITRQLR